MNEVSESVAASRARLPISKRSCPARVGDRSARDASVLVGLLEDVGLVAPERLGRIHRRVRIAHERLHPELQASAAGDPDRDRHRQLGVALDGEPLALDELAQLLAQRRAFLDVGLGQDQHEFLAAVASDQVAGTEVFGDGLGDAAQDRVTCGVAIRVVDRLEVVDVDERDAERTAIACRALDLGEQIGEERLAVCDAGQAVDGRPVICIGQGGGDRIDGDTEAFLETATGGRDLDGVVARGDLLGGLDHAPETDAFDQPRQDGGGRRGEGDGHQGGHVRPLALDHPGGGQVWVVHKEDPDHDRSHDGQDPQ